MRCVSCVVPKNLFGRHHVVGRNLRGCRGRNRAELRSVAHFAATADNPAIVALAARRSSASSPTTQSSCVSLSVRSGSQPDRRRGVHPISSTMWILPPSPRPERADILAEISSVATGPCRTHNGTRSPPRTHCEPKFLYDTVLAPRHQLTLPLPNWDIP